MIQPGSARVPVGPSPPASICGPVGASPSVEPRAFSSPFPPRGRVELSRALPPPVGLSLGSGGWARSPSPCPRAPAHPVQPPLPNFLPQPGFAFKSNLMQSETESGERPIAMLGKVPVPRADSTFDAGNYVAERDETFSIPPDYPSTQPAPPIGPCLRGKPELVAPNLAALQAANPILTGPFLFSAENGDNVLPKTMSFVPHPKASGSVAGQPMLQPVLSFDGRPMSPTRPVNPSSSFVGGSYPSSVAAAPQSPQRLRDPILERIASIDMPPPPPLPPRIVAPAAPRAVQRVDSMPPPPEPPRTDGRSYDFPVTTRATSFGTNLYPQSFTEVRLGSFSDGLEQWKPPPSVNSFQVRTEAAFAPSAGPGIGGADATYNGPQPLPRGQPQCPVQ